MPLLLRLGSPMLMGGQALASGNILMAMTSMVFPLPDPGIDGEGPQGVWGKANGAVPGVSDGQAGGNPPGEKDGGTEIFKA